MRIRTASRKAFDSRSSLGLGNTSPFYVKRPGANERGYTYRWQKASKAFLRAHPLCQCPDCDEGRIRATLSQVVDHHIPHRGDLELFWDQSNWRALAKPCHDSKTAREDHGFGNATGKRKPKIGLDGWPMG